MFIGTLAGQEPSPGTFKPRNGPAVSDVDTSNALVAGRVLRVALDRPFLRLSKLKPGVELDGRLLRPVYSGERLLLPEGTKVHVVVDRTEKQKLKKKLLQKS